MLTSLKEREIKLYIVYNSSNFKNIVMFSFSYQE